MIEIGYDKIVHTSDHFDKIQAYTEQLIRQGDMYMDDTDGETVRPPACPLAVITDHLYRSKSSVERLFLPKTAMPVSKKTLLGSKSS